MELLDHGINVVIFAIKIVPANLDTGTTQYVIHFVFCFTSPEHQTKYHHDEFESDNTSFVTYETVTNLMAEVQSQHCEMEKTYWYCIIKWPETLLLESIFFQLSEVLLRCPSPLCSSLAQK